jgi:hypothetical protein
MTTLQGRHPLIAIRTSSRRPASLLTVVLVAAVTLALAVAVALLTEDDGGSAGPIAPATAQASPERFAPDGTDLSRPHYEGRDLVPGRRP